MVLFRLAGVSGIFFVRPARSVRVFLHAEVVELVDTLS